MKGVGRLAMPRGGPERVFKIAIKGFDVPAQMIKPGQFRSGETVEVQERSDQSATAKTVTVDENNPDRLRGFIMGVRDPAEIIPWGERL